MTKRLINILSITALLFSASCIDNNYDLSDIDTNSRFYVSGLTVPVNMNPVKLDLVLDISDDSDIKKDEEGNYYFRKEGTFNSKPINVSKITLTKPKVDFGGKISVSFSLDPEIKEKIKLYAADITIGEILSDPQLMKLIGIDADTKILDLSFNSDFSSGILELSASGIDPNVKSIKYLGTETTNVSINVKVDGVQNTLKPFAINDLKLTVPKGLYAETLPGITYSPDKGTLAPVGGKLSLNQDYICSMDINVSGIDYDVFEEEGMKIFDPVKHTFTYKKQCMASGRATLTVSDLKSNVKYADIEALEHNVINFGCNVNFSRNVVVSSFQGEITYSMDDIKVDPVKINNIPEILKENGTNIDLTNPQIYFNLNNHLSAYGIGVSSALEIKGNNTITAPLVISNSEWTKLVMAPHNESLYHPEGYEFEEVRGMSGVVGSGDGQTFPEQLNIRVIKPEVPLTRLTKAIELGKDIAGVEGKWEFYTRLSLTDKAKIIYTKEWDDWSDKDLDGLTVDKATVYVTITKDVAMDAESIEFILRGNQGELRGKTAIKGDATQDITIELTGGPVSRIKGAKLNVHLRGVNKDLNKNQEIQISNLKVTVDGHYDREL